MDSAPTVTIIHGSILSILKIQVERKKLNYSQYTTICDKISWATF